MVVNGKHLCATTPLHIHPADTISPLPDQILHHILSFLPTRDVVRTTILSKRWQRVSTSFPLSDFSDSLFGFGSKALEEAPQSQVEAKQHQFLNFVHNYLLAQCHRTSTIQTFRLSMTNSYLSSRHLCSIFDGCIAIVTKQGIKELDLDLLNLDYYTLPQCIFFAKKLTALRVKSCRMKFWPGQEAMLWPSLRVLSLTSTHLDEGIVQNLFLHCPLIEKASFINCFGVSAIQLSGLKKLNAVKVVDSYGVIKTISIDGTGLQKFHYRCDCKGHIRRHYEMRDIHVNDCKSLEVLKLKGPSISSQVCQDLICKSPVLKVLVLHNNIPLVEKLNLSATNDGPLVIMATRSLRLLKISENTTLELFSCKTLRLQEVQVEMGRYGRFHADNFPRLSQNLGYFSQIKLLVLQIEVYMRPYSFNEFGTFIPPLLHISQLKLEITTVACASRWSLANRSYGKLVEVLFLFCHPECIQLVSGWGSNNEFMKVLCERLSSPTESCRYGIKSVEMVQFGGNGDRRSLSLVDFSATLPELVPGQKFDFVLTWSKD